MTFTLQLQWGEEESWCEERAGLTAESFSALAPPSLSPYVKMWWLPLHRTVVRMKGEGMGHNLVGTVEVHTNAHYHY